MVISFIFNPILISALNPIILFTRVQKIRQTFYSLIRSCFEIRMRYGRITPAVIENALAHVSNIQNQGDGLTVTEFVTETVQ